MMSNTRQVTKDLTKGPITTTMLLFAFPMIAGNLLQQFYHIADTLIVGKYLGSNALAAVGSSYTLMTFLTSILLGLCMGCGAYFSICYGERNYKQLRSSIGVSFVLIFFVTLLINGIVFVGLDEILKILHVPSEIYFVMRKYVWAIFWGISATFFCNFFASLLRAVGDSKTPLVFLGIASVMNIVLDLLFVLIFEFGVSGAAWATVISQWFSGIGLFLYVQKNVPELWLSRKDMEFSIPLVKEISHFALSTCIQQSVMNFGILMVQGLVNSFGAGVMAAFAAAVKIDSFAYMPVQDFGNAFSTFIAQNHGARKKKNQTRDEKCNLFRGSFQLERFNNCMHFRTSIIKDIHFRSREGSYSYRGRISSHRRRILYRNRNFIFVIWTLPSNSKTGNVTDTYNHLSWD